MRFCHRDRTTALLGYAVERYVTGHGQPLDRAGDSPWDVWWTCYRAQRSAAEFGMDPRHAAGRCKICTLDASSLAFHTPPKHPNGTLRRGCQCLLDWARSMRRPTPTIIWPGWRLTVSMVKPGSDPAPVRELLAESHTVVEELQRDLTPADVRRLYPDAYGREYVTRRDDYLTSAPVTAFVLVASPSAIGKAKAIKSGIRRRLGEGDALRNHLHMPDSPGDAFADLDHLASTETFLRLYERYGPYADIGIRCIASRATVAARSASISSGEPPGKLNRCPVSCTNTRPASSTNQPYTCTTGTPSGTGHGHHIKPPSTPARHAASLGSQVFTDKA